MPMLKETMLKRLLLPMVAAGGGGSAPVQDTATGNPLVFFTNLARPLKSLLIPFTPKQTGSGDPSPNNVRNIVPWDGLNLRHGGKNLLPNTASSKTVNGVTFTVNSDGTVSVSGTATAYADLTIGKSEVPNKGKIVLSGLEETVKIRWSQIRILDASDNVLGDFYGQATTRPYVINMDDYPTAKYVQIGIKREDNNVAISGTVKPMLEVGETATAYEPYVHITETDISFPSPVYGGILDAVTGVLTVYYVGFSEKWKDGRNESDRGTVTRKQFTVPFTAVQATSTTLAFCNIAKWKWNFESDDLHFYVNATNAYVFLPNGTDGETEIQIVAQLATPQEIQLTTSQITALVGNNTIWSDADGSMTAIYLKKG